MLEIPTKQYQVRTNPPILTNTHRSILLKNLKSCKKEHKKARITLRAEVEIDEMNKTEKCDFYESISQVSGQVA